MNYMFYLHQILFIHIEIAQTIKTFPKKDKPPYIVSIKAVDG